MLLLEQLAEVFGQLTYHIHQSIPPIVWEDIVRVYMLYTARLG
jgi:hypothetical protein